jgi:23S rRNA pseudouridine1911/1915/1917 synthase
MNGPTRTGIDRLRFSPPVSEIRLDKYLTRVLPEYSRAYLQKLIAQGGVLVNGQTTRASRRLIDSDVVTVELAPSPTHPLPEPIPLEVVYEDADVLVIDKPAGLTAHPAPGHPDGTLVNALLSRCPDLAVSTGDVMRPGIVHRLDKDTSGLMVIAKNDPARDYLVTQFKSRLVTKGYLVLVKGRMSPEQGMIEAPIGRDPHRRRRMAIVDEGKEATTLYRVRKHLGDYTLVEVTPVTGRTHQIRVHLSAIGYPVVGDPTYGVKSTHLARQFVHAYRLGFRLPSNGEYRELTSPLPADLELALEHLDRS